MLENGRVLRRFLFRKSPWAGEAWRFRAREGHAQQAEAHRAAADDWRHRHLALHGPGGG